MGFSSTPQKTPKPPGVFPIDIPATEQAGLNADVLGYNLSNADFAARFPGLVQARGDVLNQSLNQLTGPIDPTVQTNLMTGEFGNALSAFGGGSEEANVTGQGTIGRNTIASRYARDVMSYEDASRNSMNSLFEANPEVGLGLSGGDAADLSILNSATVNQANTLAYSARVAQQNAGIAADNASRAATTGAGTAVAGSVLAALATAIH